MAQMKDMDHWQMAYHKWLGISMAVVAVGLAIWRGWLYLRHCNPGLAYLIVATFAVAALIVQGDLGGQMSFGPD